ncbi:MAG: hypothetical protein HY868_05230 [Chloroflexi bacterium]|nr:hypothetical protein [Chloroflexota bacterium]
MTFIEQVYIELIKTAFALFVLGLTWFVGQRILAYWEIKKKRKELDIATATQPPVLIWGGTTLPDN